MAIFNQSPASQTSLTVAVPQIAIQFGGTVQSVRVNTVFVNPVPLRYTLQTGGSNVTLTIGSVTQLPTIGQIWPSGLG